MPRSWESVRSSTNWSIWTKSRGVSPLQEDCASGRDSGALEGVPLGNRAEQARYALLRAEASTRAGLDADNDSLLRIGDVYR